MASSVLTPDLLEEAHTAAEYLQWVRTLISRVKEEPDGLKQIRLRMGPAKELMNEAFPIGLLASTYFDGSEQVSIRLKIGNQNYDAIVSDCRSNPSSVQYVEVTLASDGEDDYLRMRVLHESGEVSGLGSVNKSGTQRTGLTIHVEREMVSQPEVLRQESDRLAQAIARKLGKAYPPNTLLLVGFDDTMAFDRPDNIANLEATIATYLPQLRAFHSVAIVGLQQGLFLSWSTENAI
ncbi:MAG: hypothetical protein HY848_15805 [Betaproteobacteria bacterium]|nr:hypothetical protein [Betaproteobacteria bacterium]